MKKKISELLEKFGKEIGTVILIIISDILRRIFRKNGQENLQKKVDETAPKTMIKNMSSDSGQICIETNCNFDSKGFQEISMDEKETEMWKSFISDCIGEYTKTSMNTSSFNGLLKCNVPLNELYKVKDEPGVMRGYTMKDGKFSKQAKFTEAGLENAAPLMVYQSMAFITSQYYQQILTEKLEDINGKLDKIAQVLEATDRAQLNLAYKRFVDLQKKTQYDDIDKIQALKFLDYVELIRLKYSDLYFSIKNLNIKEQKTDKEEAEEKIKLLKSTGFFQSLDFVMQAELLTYIAYVVLIKIAIYLGNEEDVKIYMSNLRLDFWDKYITQFDKIKHDVIEYLELQSQSAFFSKKAIKALKNEAEKEFDNFETSMLNLQNQLNRSVNQTIQIMDDGTIRKFMPLEVKN